MPDADKTLEFPPAGVSDAGAFGDPPSGTAAAAENVRLREALTGRARGGSRPGLSKYVPLPVDGVVGHPVQHLAVVVDPTVEAALASFEAWAPPGTGGPDDGVLDPSDNPPTEPSRNPDRLVRPGGSGVQPVRGGDGRKRPPFIRFMNMFKPPHG